VLASSLYDDGFNYLELLLVEVGVLSRSLRNSLL